MNKLNQLILALLIGIGIGYLLFKSKNVIVKTEYVKGKTITDTVTNLVPYEVKTPVYVYLPKKSDTVYKNNKQLIIQKVDTFQIIQNYIEENKYRTTLFDNDTLGKMVLEPIVQYNKLQSIAYKFTPIIKTVTVERQRRLVPFISASGNTFNLYSIGGGLYYKSIGVEVKYVTDLKNKGTEIGIHYKF